MRTPMTWIVIPLLAVVAAVLSAGAATASGTTCNSCADCTTKINSGLYDTVTLSVNIVGHSGGCIGFHGVNNVVFDCNGLQIDGDDAAIDPDRGVGIFSATGNTVRNCTITDFSDGIYLYYANNNTFTNNTAQSNTVDGIRLENSHSNTISSNTASYNGDDGISLTSSNNTAINGNTVCQNVGLDFNLSSSSGNSGDNNSCDKPDGWNDAGTSGCTSSCPTTAKCTSCSDCSAKLNGSYETVMLASNIMQHAGTCIVFGASNVVFDGGGYVIDGDDLGSDSGITMSGRSGNTVRNCTVQDFQHGISLYNSSNNTVEKNTTKSNSSNGIYLSGSASNHLYTNQARDNGTGINLSSSASNQLYNNDVTANKSVGIRLDLSDSNQISFNDVHDNDHSQPAWGLYLYSSDSNTIHNNTLEDNYQGIKLDNCTSNTINLNTICSQQGTDVSMVGGSTGNSGDNNTCEDTYNWNDTGKKGCTYRCYLCSDGKKNGDEKGMDCGGTYCPPCSLCATGAKYAPTDTICTQSWPTSQGPDIDLNSENASCSLVEVCAKDLDYLVEDALLCCEYEDYTTKLSGNREKGKEAACSYAQGQAYSNDFRHKVTPTTLKQCLGHYLIRSFGAEAVYMQGYFYGELCCHGHDECPSACREWHVEPPAYEMGIWYACAENTCPKPDFKMGGHVCEYTDAWIFGTYGNDGYWNSDTDFHANNDSFGEPPAHATINRLSTGTCVDYAVALATALRKVGYAKQDVLGVDGDGHGYNLVRFPGEVKWHYVDTVSNRGDEVFGGSGFTSPDHHCCKGTPNSCSSMTTEKECTQGGCTWSAGSCTGTPSESACGVFTTGSSCQAAAGCSWQFCVWYDYCRSLDDGCYNDSYDEDTDNCPSNSNIYGCESVATASSLAAVTPLAPPLETSPNPWALPAAPEQQDGECTELHPCVRREVVEVQEPPPPVDLEVHKYVSREEIILGDAVEIAIVVRNNEDVPVQAVVQETFVPGVNYLGLHPEEARYEGYHYLFHQWTLQLPPNEAETMLFQVLPTSVGVHTLEPTRVSAGGSSYRASTPPVKVVCNPNGVCDRGEDYRTCPQDCATGTADDYCDLTADGRIDPDCTYDVDPDFNPEADSDGDGVRDADDRCPLTRRGSTVDRVGCSCDQKICDDGDPLTADRCDARTASCRYLPDGDGDGVPDAEDNCRGVPNPDQADSDGDGLGDACEIGGIGSDTTLAPGVYHIPAPEGQAAITIGSSGVVLDCNGALLMGTGTGYGIHVPEGVNDVVIRNCTVRGYRYGITVRGSSGDEIVHNTLEFNEYGVVLDRSSRVQLVENLFSGNGRGGVYLEGSEANAVLDNTIVGSGKAGIFVHSSPGNEISANYVCGQAGSDIYVYESEGSGGDNTCGTAEGWNDEGTRGCSYECQDAVLHVSPAWSSALVSDTVVVELRLVDVENLYAAQIELAFDPAVLEVIDAYDFQPGVQIEEGEFPVPDTVIRNQVDNQRGAIQYAVSLQGDKSGVNGSGVLARILFHGKAEGVSPLHFTRAILSDPQSLEIPTRVVDGVVAVHGAAGVISGRVVLERRASNAGAQVCVGDHCTNSAADGSYVLADVPPGLQTVFVRRESYLTTFRQVNVPPEPVGLPEVTLLGGDINQDDRIEQFDAMSAGLAWNATSMDPQWDRRADITDDGNVNVLDMVAIQFNWDSLAPGPWGEAVLLRQAADLARPPVSEDAASRVVLSPGLAAPTGAGQTVDLEIRVEEVTDLYGGRIQLSFDPTVLQVVDADPSDGAPGVQIRPGDFLDPFHQFVLVNRADNSAGTIDFAVTQLHPATARSGSGVLATVTFEVVGQSSSAVHLVGVRLGDDTRPDPLEIPTQTRDALVTEGGGVRIYLPVTLVP